jgi:L-fucose isomerase-like protein
MCATNSDILDRMLSILPLTSSITPDGACDAVVERLAVLLTRCGVAHRFVAGVDGPADALLLVSGGTEHLALAACEGASGPVVLLAHPERNSLPAALEVLGRLRQQGRRGRVVLVGDGAPAGEDLVHLARHVEVHRTLRATRLGRIGTPSDWLVASTPPAAGVAEAWGPTVVDVPLAEVVEAMRAVDRGEAEAIRAAFVAGAEEVLEPTAADLDAAAAVVAALRAVVARHRLDACAVRCFDLVVDQRTTGCLALSSLLDEGIVAGCEGDVPATLTMLVLQLLTGEPTFMANPQGIDAAANTVDLAHCTIARRMVSRYTLRSHFESSLGVGIAGTLDPGAATVARVGGTGLRELFAADAELVLGGSSPLRCRTQARVRLATPVAELLDRPLGNHLVLARGHRAAELRDYHALFVAG